MTLSQDAAWVSAALAFAHADSKFKNWTEHQTSAYVKWRTQQLQRMLLFFPTGTGKSKTTLGLMHSRGHAEVVVIAPPKTHASWRADAKALGMTIRTDSHQKFRMKNTSYKKTIPIIVDEFHMLGGHTGMGWKKLNRMAAHLQAEIILASATPNYNDAERVFCITAICRQNASNRNFLTWLYENCETEPNYFSTIPIVTGFKEFDSAMDYLVAEPYTAYIPDEAVWTAKELVLFDPPRPHFEEYNLYRRGDRPRLVASDMEKRHKRVDLQYISDNGYLREEIVESLAEHFWSQYDGEKILVFCNHKTVAEAFIRTYQQADSHWLITGDTKHVDVERYKREFIEQEGSGVLVGTTALATGVDGIDKVCQTMLILDDIVGDNSLRRQLIGRILPRGGDDGIERIVVTATFV